jgi:hypothetical protein
VVTYEDRESFQLLVRDKKPFVFKIHGDLTRPQTIILGWKRYQGLFKKPEYAALRKFIHNLLFDRTLLFLGCSLQGTEYAGYFLDYVKDHEGALPGPHYALVEEGTLSDEKRGEWEGKLGVQILEYKPDPDYSQVWEFIASLKPGNISPPRPSSAWENFYLAEERPDYLAMQLHREKEAASCRYITPKLTNAIATDAYIARHCQDELGKFEEKVADFNGFRDRTTDLMLGRSKNIVDLLARGIEVRLVFLASTITEEIDKLHEVAVERYGYALSLLDKYPAHLHMRAYNYPIPREEFMKCSFALVFGQTASPDVAIFYAPQASSNKFSTHIVQINTPYVTERIALFERYWAASLSEQDTIALLRKATE